MEKQEVIFKLKDKIDDIEGFLSWELRERKIATNQLKFAIDVVNLLDEPEITKEHVKPVIPPWVADIIENNRISQRESPSDLWRFIRRDKRFLKWFLCDLPDVSYREVEEIVLTAILFGYTIESPKTSQITVKRYDGSIYKTDIPESEARKLIEEWKQDE